MSGVATKYSVVTIQVIPMTSTVPFAMSNVEAMLSPIAETVMMRHAWKMRFFRLGVK